MTQLLLIAAALVVIYSIARARTRATKRAEPLGPHATFDGGEQYATADERLHIEHDGPSGAGEGLLLAIVAALRARGFATHPVEPEAYGFMSVVEIDGEDVILTLGAGGEQAWILFVRAPSGKVPVEIMNALRTLHVRNVTWSL